MNAPPVVDATARQFESWKGVAIISDTLGVSGWALAGGQMVGLHLLIADLPFLRVTIDADIIIDVRVRPDAARLVSTALVGMQPVLTTRFTGSNRLLAVSSTYWVPTVFVRGRSRFHRQQRCLRRVGHNSCSEQPSFL
jgi:hypothetical protein